MKNIKLKNEKLTKVDAVIDIINDMELKDKLRLGVCMSTSSYTNLLYNKNELNKLFDNKLKEIDEEYRTSYVNMSKYKIVMIVMAKIMEMNEEEQNQVVMYLNNNINI